MIKIGVMGAGTMGRGIAQVAMMNGHECILYDTNERILAKASSFIEDRIHQKVKKKKITNKQGESYLQKIAYSHKIKDFSDCDLIIEAIFEDIEIKKIAFASLDRIISDSTIVASNSSSLSITEISSSISNPQRVVGCHFFNPAPVMKLVEIIPTLHTEERVLHQVLELMDSWNKITVQSRDYPGFIVNRVARPFYTESLRIVEEGLYSFQEVDLSLKKFGGFKMGPFELIDLIGNDINFKVTESLFTNFYYLEKYRPSLLQKRMVQAGYLGEKSGKGYFVGQKLNQPMNVDFQVFLRVISMLINSALDTLFWKLCSLEDLEKAVKFGLNYPKGLIEWGSQLGWEVVYYELSELQMHYKDSRYQPCPLLSQIVEKGIFPEELYV